jgi:PEP-CTERM motif
MSVQKLISHRGKLGTKQIVDFVVFRCHIPDEDCGPFAQFGLSRRDTTTTISKDNRAFNAYTVDLWSNGPNLGGYQLNDSLNGAPFVTPNMDGLAYGVNFAASPTPEPSSLLLLGTGMTGLFSLMRRKWTA